MVDIFLLSFYLLAIYQPFDIVWHCNRPVFKNKFISHRQKLNVRLWNFFVYFSVIKLGRSPNITPFPKLPFALLKIKWKFFEQVKPTFNIRIFSVTFVYTMWTNHNVYCGFLDLYFVPQQAQLYPEQWQRDVNWRLISCTAPWYRAWFTPFVSTGPGLTRYA